MWPVCGLRVPQSRTEVLQSTAAWTCRACDFDLCVDCQEFGMPNPPAGMRHHEALPMRAHAQAVVAIAGAPSVPAATAATPNSALSMVRSAKLMTATAAVAAPAIAAAAAAASTVIVPHSATSAIRSPQTMTVVAPTARSALTSMSSTSSSSGIPSNMCRGKSYGWCNEEDCDCDEYERRTAAVDSTCGVCGHPPLRHEKLEST
jgi:hypothetical protein